jgi:streptogramin lyase
MEPLESRQLLTSVTEYRLPSPAAQPLAITAGPGGSIWFIEQRANEIGTINLVTGGISSFPIPTPNSYAYGITAGPDGNIWFTEESAGKIGILDPANDEITEISLNEPGALPYGITTGPDGNIWFTALGTSQIGMINPTTHAISWFSTPTPNAEPEGISAGPDGNLYFTEFMANQIGVVNATTHSMSEFALPTPGAEPDAIAAGPGGKMYFTEYAAGMIGMLDPSTGAISNSRIPTLGSAPSGIALGPDGNIWFAEQGAGAIGVLNPSNDAITELSTPTADSAPYGVAAGPGGDVWFTEGTAGAIGSVNLRVVPHLVVTTGPPASLPDGGSFGLVVTAEYAAGLVASDYSGVVTVALAGGSRGTLGGTLSVTASQGVASFAGLTLNAPTGSDALVVTGAAASPVATSAIRVTGSQTPSGGSLTPVITSEQIVTAGKGKRAHAAAIVLHFNTALLASRARALRNYTVVRYTRRGSSLIAHPVAVRAAYNSTAQTVKLTLVGNPRFALGGELVVSTSPKSGIEDIEGTPLAATSTGSGSGNAVFLIAPGATGISQ